MDPQGTIVSTGKKLIKWPSEHYAVSSPVLSKRDKLDPKIEEEAPDPLQHRVLAVYVAIYRTVAGAWYRNHIRWLEEWLPYETYSGLPKRECLEMTWDLQARIQRAASNGNSMAILLLDYYKFFDMFEHKFIRDFMQCAGVDVQLVDLIYNINSNAKRRIKLGATYGEPMEQTNSLGQGDPLSLLAALTYVGVLAKYIMKNFDGITMASVIDDRNITGPPDHVIRAMSAIFRYDKLAGHVNNIDKMAISAVHLEDRKWLAKMTTGAGYLHNGSDEDGTPKKAVRIFTTEKVAGETITIHITGNKQYVTKRTRYTMESAIRNENVATSQEQKRGETPRGDQGVCMMWLKSSHLPGFVKGLVNEA